MGYVDFFRIRDARWGKQSEQRLENICPYYFAIVT